MASEDAISEAVTTMVAELNAYIGTLTTAEAVSLAGATVNGMSIIGRMSDMDPGTIAMTLTFQAEVAAMLLTPAALRLGTPAEALYDQFQEITTRLFTNLNTARGLDTPVFIPQHEENHDGN